MKMTQFGTVKLCFDSKVSMHKRVRLRPKLDLVLTDFNFVRNGHLLSYNIFPKSDIKMLRFKYKVKDKIIELSTQKSIFFFFEETQVHLDRV